MKGRCVDAIKQFFKTKDPVKWLFYGDSITHGALHTCGSRDYTEHFTERVRYELGRTMDVVIKTAISGNKTRNLLESFDWRVAQFKPHVVFIMIGMNDCSDKSGITPQEFEKNLHTLDERIEALGGKTVLQTTCPIIPGGAPDREPQFPAFMDVIRRVAADRRLPLVDHTQYWLENKAKLYYWMSNTFHPNAYGHTAFAHLLFKALDIFDPASPSCRLFVP